MNLSMYNNSGLKLDDNAVSNLCLNRRKCTPISWNIFVSGSLIDKYKNKKPFTFEGALGLQFVIPNILKIPRLLTFNTEFDNINLSLINSVLNKSNTCPVLFIGDNIKIYDYMELCKSLYSYHTTSPKVFIEYEFYNINITFQKSGNVLIFIELEMTLLQSYLYCDNNTLYYCICSNIYYTYDSHGNKKSYYSGIFVPICSSINCKNGVFKPSGFTTYSSNLLISPNNGYYNNKPLQLNLSGYCNCTFKVINGQIIYNDIQLSSNLSLNKSSITNMIITNTNVTGMYIDINFFTYYVNKSTTVINTTLNSTDQCDVFETTLSQGMYTTNSSYIYSDGNYAYWCGGSYPSLLNINVYKITIYRYGISSDTFSFTPYVIQPSNYIQELLNINNTPIAVYNTSEFILKCLDKLISITTPNVAINSDAWIIKNRFTSIINTHSLVKNIFKDYPICYNLRLSGLNVAIIPLAQSGYNINNLILFSIDIVKYDTRNEYLRNYESSQHIYEDVILCNIYPDYSINGIGFVLKSEFPISDIYEVYFNCNISICELKAYNMHDIIEYARSIEDTNFFEITSQARNVFSSIPVYTPVFYKYIMTNNIKVRSIFQTGE